MSCPQHPKPKWCALLWMQNSSPTPNYTRGDGALPTQAHPSHHRQHYGTRAHHGHHDAQSLQVNGSTICQCQYLWHKGILNRADYASKHHAHKQSAGMPILCLRQQHTTASAMKSCTTIFTTSCLAHLRGCVNYPSIQLDTHLYPSNQTSLT